MDAPARWEGRIAMRATKTRRTSIWFTGAGNREETPSWADQESGHEEMRYLVVRNDSTMDWWEYPQQAEEEDDIEVKDSSKKALNRSGYELKGGLKLFRNHSVSCSSEELGRWNNKLSIATKNHGKPTASALLSSHVFGFDSESVRDVVAEVVRELIQSSDSESEQSTAVLAGEEVAAPEETNTLSSANQSGKSQGGTKVEDANDQDTSNQPGQSMLASNLESSSAATEATSPHSLLGDSVVDLSGGEASAEPSSVRRTTSISRQASCNWFIGILSRCAGCSAEEVRRRREAQRMARRREAEVLAQRTEEHLAAVVARSEESTNKFLNFCFEHIDKKLDKLENIDRRLQKLEKAVESQRRASNYTPDGRRRRERSNSRESTFGRGTMGRDSYATRTPSPGLRDSDATRTPSPIPQDSAKRTPSPVELVPGGKVVQISEHKVRSPERTGV